MKNKEELLKSQGKLNPSDIEEIQWIIEELGNLIEKEESLVKEIMILSSKL